ncbi:hypothetical protein B0T14DRAFT_567482 [Immersiella caudata]|uniref:Uncharacterized protein n=1 Tax=Immersiella caudata TaxID=314043 RepID=A0AA40C0F1_9PEZI|nr:hypothetical protein B0T14DRAFT_567482 [Immersiella caudata]
MHRHRLMLAALSAAIATSFALPAQHGSLDDVRITNQTPALDSASDSNVFDKRQDSPPEGTFDWSSDSSETPGSNCSGDCLGAAWHGDAQQAKRGGEISGGSIEDDNYSVDGTSWDNGSAWDN